LNIAAFTINKAWLQADLDAMGRAGHKVRIWRPASRTRNEVRTPRDQLNLMNVSRLMDWCDVAYFDWCQYPFSEACTLQSTNCKIVVRARGMPFFQIYKKFPWNKVDLVVGHQLIGQRLREAEQRPRFLHLPQGSNPTFFIMPKNREYGKNLAMHSTTIRYRKRVYSSIQAFYDLLLHDPEWTFHLKGEWEQGFGAAWEGSQYTDPCKELIEDLNISDAIELTQNVSKGAWRDWLHDKDVIISNGIREGTHVSLAEAMMCGVYPLVNCWRGADNYYPKENVYRTQRELVDKILAWQELDVVEKTQLSQDMREWALERYDARDIADRMVQEFETL